LSKDLRLQNFLTPLRDVAETLNAGVPDGHWWGVTFIDQRFLMNASWSPSIETYRVGDHYRLKLSGPCHLEPSLNLWQIHELGFLGWQAEQEAPCECFWTDLLEVEWASERFSAALEAHYMIYGISESCRLLGTSFHVIEELLTMETARFFRADGTVRLRSNSKSREDLR